MTNQDYRRPSAAEAVQFGEFELLHGGTSEYYVDKYPSSRPIRLPRAVAVASQTDRRLTTSSAASRWVVPLAAATSVAAGASPMSSRAKATQRFTGRPT